ncbi:MAG: polymer-forming cytoskeletal protein [Gammaproteobacteria bacterium]|nr:polymer-forming cytoskeletal protein [Gammaproteobacteria bacterium]MBU6509229.1 polymer-forming cytoskeletal protein [Gammaproteobacteria bacterium]MDE1983769.1 polymer-forming cytoskeletal protein [Gammaproteobacteria bacterium]MDE2107891.1 polymer-forming cytoskeletal protein [Gammaproteobacteria bacterium]MDE2459816.1 polymer-forming cytoskeletal protein [Gammaproteobacteria bacterium]
MFSGKNQRPAVRIDTLVGRNTEIHGDVQFSGGLHVDGNIHGNVTAGDGGESVLSLSQHGLIKGEIRVPHVTINGAVEGNVYASQRLELGAEARVTGDVQYNLIEMAVGATVDGKMVHKPAGPVLALSHQKSETPVAPSSRGALREG